MVTWFRLRWEKQTESVRKLLEKLMEGVGVMAIKGCIVTEDRGYAKESFLEIFSEFGVASVFIMRDNVLPCNSSLRIIDFTKTGSIWKRREDH